MAKKKTHGEFVVTVDYNEIVVEADEVGYTNQGDLAFVTKDYEKDLQGSVVAKIAKGSWTVVRRTK